MWSCASPVYKRFYDVRNGHGDSCRNRRWPEVAEYDSRRHRVIFQGPRTILVVVLRNIHDLDVSDVSLQGLDGSIKGIPHPDLAAGIEYEHRSKKEFTTQNYGKESTSPHHEFQAVTDEETRNRVNSGAAAKKHGRYIMSIRECRESLEKEGFDTSKLRDVEIWALVLYTGPMVCSPCSLLNSVRVLALVVVRFRLRT